MNAELVVSLFGPQAVHESRPEETRVTVEEFDPRKVALSLRQRGARFVTMTAVLAEEGVTLMYHWDIEGELLTVRTACSGEAVSIADILPAADWVEREIHDYYAVEFAGRAATPPLMLRAGDAPGLFSRTDSAGRSADPAYTDKTGEEAR